MGYSIQLSFTGILKNAQIMQITEETEENSPFQKYQLSFLDRQIKNIGEIIPYLSCSIDMKKYAAKNPDLVREVTILEIKEQLQENVTITTSDNQNLKFTVIDTTGSIKNYLKNVSTITILRPDSPIIENYCS